MPIVRTCLLLLPIFAVVQSSTPALADVAFGLKPTENATDVEDYKRYQKRYDDALRRWEHQLDEYDQGGFGIRLVIPFAIVFAAMCGFLIFLLPRLTKNMWGHYDNYVDRLEAKIDALIDAIDRHNERQDSDGSG